MSQPETIRIFLFDLTHTGQKVAVDNFPLGVGYVAAFLETYSQLPIQTHLIKFPDEVDALFDQFRPKIIGFSNYIWNLDLSHRFAKAIKAVFPGTIAIFGGPNFPKGHDEQEAFLRKYTAIDFYVEGEGEKPFMSLVEKLYATDFSANDVKTIPIPGVRTLYKDSLLSYESEQRVGNIDEIPSPYLAGKMDKFFETSLMPLIQINRGCPFSCTYCVEGGEYHNHVAKRKQMESVAAELKYIASRARNNKQLFIADSNFGMYKEDIESAKILRKTMAEHGYPSYIHVATGKNKKSLVLELAKILQGKLRLSGSVQSLDPVVLEKVKRKNISKYQLLKVAEDARKIGANSYSEVILGLPGDSLKAHLESMKGVIEAGFNIVLPWTLLLLKGSELATSETKKRYNFTCKYRVLPRCAGIYRFHGKDIVSGEIEEVGVASDTLSLEDYMECRLFTFTAAIFYNDRIFEEIIESIKNLGLSPFEWLSIIHHRKESFPEKIKKLYVGYEEETRKELWNSEEELEAFINQPQNMKKYISGELGFNVMYYYRSKVFSECMKELNDIAFDCAKELVFRESREHYKAKERYFDELKNFSLKRKDDIFSFQHTYEIAFSYDFKRMLEEGSWEVDFDKNEKPEEYRYVFYHSDEQKQAVREQMNVFGSDIIGLTKVLSRIHISKIYRKIDLVSQNGKHAISL